MVGNPFGSLNQFLKVKLDVFFAECRVFCVSLPSVKSYLYYLNESVIKVEGVGLGLHVRLLPD